ncbi:MAG TPA: tyrosine protein phosphatase [Alphaproteobacteria bacterium]|nr:tyrosine protein phosphatase [Alphaproteobacteria bacterium]
MAIEKVSNDLIWVSNLRKLSEALERSQPSHVVSLLAPEVSFDRLSAIAADCHLDLRFHDITGERPDRIAPNRDHVQALVDFVRVWNRSGSLLIHCAHGQSRSTAAAFIVLAMQNPGREDEVASILRDRAKHARPNARMVRLADEVLGAGGRLIDALEKMGEPTMAAFTEPFSLPLRV